MREPSWLQLADSAPQVSMRVGVHAEDARRPTVSPASDVREDVGANQREDAVADDHELGGVDTQVVDALQLEGRLVAGLDHDRPRGLQPLGVGEELLRIAEPVLRP